MSDTQDAAKAAIRAMIDDPSISPADTLENLDELEAIIGDAVEQLVEAGRNQEAKQEHLF